MTQRIIITGAMGSGKSTVIGQLAKAYTTVKEPAREILAQQRQINGHGLPECDPNLFCHLLLSRSIQNYQTLDACKKPALFDRGIADTIAYAHYFGLDSQPFENAAQHFQYYSKVFWLGAWEAIYTNDSERRMSFAESYDFAKHLKNIYLQLGYSLIEVPKQSINKRMKFISNKIESFTHTEKQA